MRYVCILKVKLKRSYNVKNLKTKRLEFLKRYDKGPKDIKFVTDGKK
jgi:hypothetical protein